MRVDTLKTLLPEVKAATGRMDTVLLAQILCGLKGEKFGYASDMDDILWVFNERDETVFCANQEKRPDTSIDAARALCRELGYEGDSGKSRHGRQVATVWVKDKIAWICEAASHLTSEPLAILTALIRSEIARLEAEKETAQHAAQCECCGESRHLHTADNNERLCTTCLGQRSDEIDS